MLKQLIQKILKQGLQYALATKNHTGKLKFVKTALDKVLTEWDATATEVLLSFPVEDQFEIIQFLNHRIPSPVTDGMLHSVSGWHSKLEQRIMKGVWITEEEEQQVEKALKVFATPVLSSRRDAYRPKATDATMGWELDYSPAKDAEGAIKLTRTGQYRWFLLDDGAGKGGKKFGLLPTTRPVDRPIIPLVWPDDDPEAKVLNTLSRKAHQPAVSVVTQDDTLEGQQAELVLLDAMIMAAMTEDEKAVLEAQRVVLVTRMERTPKPKIRIPRKATKA